MVDASRPILIGFTLLLAACSDDIALPQAPAARSGTSDPNAAGATAGASVATPGPAATSEAALACQRADALEMSRTGALPLRRLTRTEYNNTVLDLFGDSSRPANAFALDDAVGPLLNNVASAVSALMAEQYRDAAEAIAARASAGVVNALSCDVTKVAEATCIARVIDTYGRRTFRRPVSADERAALVALAASVEAESDARATFTTRVRVLLAAMLQSGSFLYRTEVGVVVPGTSAAALDDYELATRLSYLLWASGPDDALLDAAAASKLSNAQGMQEQVARLLRDARFARAVESLHTQWLGLDELALLSKDENAYPDFNATLRDAMWSDVTNFVDEIVVRGDARLETLLTAPFAFVTPSNAALYGVRYTGKSGEPVKVELAPSQRAGLLTQPAFLAVHANPNQSSPIKRGVAIRERLLCQGLPAPPPDVPAPPAPRAGATTRERFATHTSVAACASCHTLIDPIGFGLEHYDGLGRYRSTENGLAIDSSGELTGSVDGAGRFDGAVELAERLAHSETVRSCVASVWLRFALGRAADACTLRSAQQDFAASDYDIRKLIVAITQTDAFRYGRAR